MIKVFGVKDCPYCEFVKPQLDERFMYIDINDVHSLKEFVDLRESRPEFDEMRKEDDLGLPVFVREDGSVSFKPEEFGLTSYSGKNTCSLKNKGNC